MLAVCVHTADRVHEIHYFCVTSARTVFRTALWEKGLSHGLLCAVLLNWKLHASCPSVLLYILELDYCRSESSPAERAISAQRVRVVIICIRLFRPHHHRRHPSCAPACTAHPLLQKMLLMLSLTSRIAHSFRFKAITRVLGSIYFWIALRHSVIHVYVSRRRRLLCPNDDGDDGRSVKCTVFGVSVRCESENTIESTSTCLQLLCVCVCCSIYT